MRNDIQTCPARYRPKPHRVLRSRLLMPYVAAVVIIACAGAGYASTSNSHDKIGRAYSLMAMDRLLLAEDLLQQALATFAQSGDKAGMAEVHAALGNLYKNSLYVNGRSSAQFKRRGTYDGTYTKSLENFAMCRDLYRQVGEGSGEAKCLLGAGNAYSLRGEHDEACKAYREGLETYVAAKQAGGNFREPEIFSSYPNLGALIEAFMKKDACSQ